MLTWWLEPNKPGRTFTGVLLASVVIGLIISFVAIWIQDQVGRPHYERRTIDGVECIIDNYKSEAVSCEWPDK